MSIWTKWRKKQDDAGHPPDSHSLPDFVRGIQHAVNSAQLMAEKNQIGFLDRHFKDDGSPEVIITKIPGTKLCLVVPTATISQPPDMMLEEMEIRMAVRFDSTEVKPAHPKDAEVTRTSFKVALSGAHQDDKKSNVVDIVMKFKRGDPPEGVARIIAEFVNMVKPADLDEALKNFPQIAGPKSDQAASDQDQTPPAMPAQP